MDNESKITQKKRETILKWSEIKLMEKTWKYTRKDHKRMEYTLKELRTEFTLDVTLKQKTCFSYYVDRMQIYLPNSFN